MGRLIDADIAEERINALLNLLDQVCGDVREQCVTDRVCGLCEYDCRAHISESGDWDEECPGFEKDDCFRMEESFKKKFTEPIPTVDAVPVKRGKWNQTGAISYRCSECNYLPLENHTNFCPNCGADMREVSE